MLRYAEIAYFWGFTPLALLEKIPKGQPGWQNTPYARSLEIVRQKLTGWSPEQQEKANIGILTGRVNSPSNAVVVDLDKGTGGLERWQRWVAANGLPETFTVETGSGGLHVYFQYDDRAAALININTSVQYGIDFRTTGGQVVFPGSLHPKSGRPYFIRSGYTNRGGELVPILAPMPDWLPIYLAALRAGTAP